MAAEPPPVTGAPAASSLVSASTKVKASSTLNRNRAEYGPAHVFDGVADTCWNSDQGLPQTLTVDFERQVRVSEVRVMFQGGFVGSNCDVAIGTGPKGKTFVEVCTIHPADVNTRQDFVLPGSPAACRKLRLSFTTSTDFYGRVTVYALDVLGRDGGGEESVVDSVGGGGSSRGADGGGDDSGGEKGGRGSGGGAVGAGVDDDAASGAGAGSGLGIGGDGGGNGEAVS